MSPKDEDQTETEQTEAPGPMLDMSQADVKKMITKAKAKGYITYDELNRVLPPDQLLRLLQADIAKTAHRLLDEAGHCKLKRTGLLENFTDGLACLSGLQKLWDLMAF